MYNVCIYSMYRLLYSLGTGVLHIFSSSIQIQTLSSIKEVQGLQRNYFRHFIHKKIEVNFHNVVCLVCVFYLRVLFRLSQFWFYLINWNLNKIDNIESTKKVDQILEMPRLGEFYDYCFMNHKCYRKSIFTMKWCFSNNLQGPIHGARDAATYIYNIIGFSS